MNLRRILIWFGLAAILFGYLAPISQQEDTLYFFMGGRYWSSSTYVLFALLAAFAALAMRKAEVLWVIGLIILGVLINDFRLTLYFWNDELSWGWLLLFSGALFLVITVFLGEDIDRLGKIGDSVKAFFTFLRPIQPPEGEEEEDASGDTEIEVVPDGQDTPTE